jgi:hypothetical protein
MLGPDALLKAEIRESGADAERLDSLTTRLKRQLDQITVTALERDHSAQPYGHKGIDSATIGSVIVAVASSSVLVETLRMISTWASSAKGRSVKVTYGDKSIELTSASVEDQESLVRDFVARIREEDTDEPREEQT